MHIKFQSLQSLLETIGHKIGNVEAGQLTSIHYPDWSIPIAAIKKRTIYLDHGNEQTLHVFVTPCGKPIMLKHNWELHSQETALL